MIKLTADEIRTIIYNELRLHPYGEDLIISRLCAISILEAELKKEREETK